MPKVDTANGSKITKASTPHNQPCFQPIEITRAQSREPRLHGGYGPEVFTICRPIPGTYGVKTHYYADHAQKLTSPVTVQLEFLTRFDIAATANAKP